MSDRNHLLRSAGFTGRTLTVAGLSLLILVAGAVLTWHSLQPTPQELLRRGLAEAPRQPAVAEQTLTRAVNASGGRDPNPQIALCRLLLRRKAFQEAFSLFQKIDLPACRSDLLFAFGRDALRMDQRTEGLSALETVIQSNCRERVAALELLITDFREWGQRQKQLHAATLLTQVEPENPRRWADLLEIQTTLGLDSDVIATLETALQHDFPPEILRHLQSSLVQQLVNRGDVKGARREWETLRKLEGDSAGVRGFEVYVCRLEGDLGRSLQLVNSIVSETPNLPFPRFTRGVVLLDLRRFSEAAEELEIVIAAQPFNAPAYFKLSEACRGLGKVDLSRTYQQRAAEISSTQIRLSSLMKKREADPLDPSVYRDLEQAHRELGDLETAKHWASWAVRVTQPRPATAKNE